MKRAVIMADGKGNRWRHYLGVPKHFAVVNGEPLIVRTVRLLNAGDPKLDVIVTSHDPLYEIPGSRRYEPKNNVYEIDRFTQELITDDMCFLYGDVYYTDDAMDVILSTRADRVLFFGNRGTIAAVKIQDAACFRTHVNRVRRLYLEGEIKRCVGWQVYRSFTGQGFDGPTDFSRAFVFLDEETADFNSPEEYRRRSGKNQSAPNLSGRAPEDNVS